MGTALSPGALKCHLKLSGPSFCGKAASLLAPCDGKEPLLPDSSFHKLDWRAPVWFSWCSCFFDLGRFQNPYVSVVLYLLLAFQGLWLVYCHMTPVTHHFFLLLGCSKF